MSNRVVRVGVIGLGFMGATHVRAYQDAAAAGFPCELVAVADLKERRRQGYLADAGGNIDTGAATEQRSFDPLRARGYESAEALLADPDVDLVSICTRTDSHVQLARLALEAGKHVVVEKPVSIRADDIRALLEVQRRAKRSCMPAMCMRFWPGWDWLKQRIDDRAYGKCESAAFHRLASPPTWAAEFYRDGSKSGGAIVDLHIHDADFVRSCFGDPDAVSSAGRVGHSGAIDHITTLYRYEHGNGPHHVVAEGGWDHSPGFPFTMRYTAIFEHATATFDISRKSPLMLHRDGKSEPVEIDSTSGYDGEIRHLVLALSSGEAPQVSLQDALAVTELIDAERKSVETRERVPFTQR